jgi:hypothetical protein
MLALALAAVSYNLAFGLMGAMASYDSKLPYTVITSAARAAIKPEDLEATRSTRRLLLVVVDGLRADSSEQMPFVNELRAKGFSGVLRVGQPSYSKPGYAAISTGARQDVTGVILNEFQGETPAETIWSVAREYGLTTATVADEWWTELAGPVITYDHNYPDVAFSQQDLDDRTNAQAIKSLSEEQTDLTLVHYAATDETAHENGGANSEEYKAAAAHIDGLIEQLAAQLDLTRDTVIVTADHGHLAKNPGVGSGHGGWEEEVLEVPLVAAGAGIQPGKLEGIQPEVNLTPTMAALLGIRVPAESQGQIMFEMLTAPLSTKAKLAVARAKVMAPFASAYMAKYRQGAYQFDTSAAEKALQAGQYQQALDAADPVKVIQALDAALPTAAAAGRKARIWSFALGLLAVAILVAALTRQARSVEMGAPMGKVTTLRALHMIVDHMICYLLVDYLAYRFGLGATYSLGALPGTDIPALMRFFFYPALAGVLVTGIWNLALAWKKTRIERVVAVEIAIGSGLAASLLMVIIGFWWVDASLAILPDFHMAYITLAHMLKLVFLAVPALLLPITAAVLPRAKSTGKPAAKSAA